MRRGPLADSYPGAVALVVFSLIPYLILTAAMLPLSKVIGQDLGISPGSLDVAVALSTAGYTAGTVLALQFAVHLPARRMLLVYEAVFVLASALTAWSPTGQVFIAGFIVQGLCTSLMLIAAVPPLVTSWPAAKMPRTGAIMNLCIFGAVAAGPTIGAAQLNGHNWRPLFWGVTAVAVLALLFALLTFEDEPAKDRGARWDTTALVLTIVGSAAAFYGAGKLQGSMKVSAAALVPLIAGAVLIIVMVVHQHQSDRPLMPVEVATTSMPVTGIFIALMASSAGFGIMELLLQSLQQDSTPIHTALLFLPEFAAAILIAFVFGALFKTRFTPLLALGGLVALAAAAALSTHLLPTSGWKLAAVTALTGIGVAASVSPALFMAGFSLESRLLQPIFAMIELMRGVTAFLVAPILVFLISVLGSKQLTGTRNALWICFGLAVFGLVGGCFLYVTSRPRLVVPDIEAWQGAPDQPAWESPRLFDAVRPHGAHIAPDAYPHHEADTEGAREASRATR